MLPSSAEKIVSNQRRISFSELPPFPAEAKAGGFSLTTHHQTKILGAPLITVSAA